MPFFVGSFSSVRGRGTGSRSGFGFDALFRLGHSTLRLSRNGLEIRNALLPRLRRWELIPLKGESGARHVGKSQITCVGNRIRGDLGKLGCGYLESLLEEIAVIFSLPLTLSFPFSTFSREFPNMLLGCGCF